MKFNCSPISFLEEENLLELYPTRKWGTTSNTESNDMPYNIIYSFIFSVEKVLVWNLNRR
jgi:hypothetical protein